MDTETFEEVLKKVTPLIEKKDTHLRQSILAAERLSLTLRHLATGSYNKTFLLVAYYLFICIYTFRRIARFIIIDF